MTRSLLVVFLVVHGLLHLAIWLAPTAEEPSKPPPFEPDHSALLTATDLTTSATHRIANTLAVGAAAGYVLAGMAAAADAVWVAPAALIAGLAGLVLKLLFFHPWLILGALLDAAVVSTAVLQWPAALT